MEISPLTKKLKLTPHEKITIRVLKNTGKLSEEEIALLLGCDQATVSKTCENKK